MTELPELPHWIAGQPAPFRGDHLDVSDPSTGRVTARLAVAGAAEVDDAVAAARAAFEKWSQTPLHRRVQILFRFRQLLDDERDALARLVASDHGKTVDDARGEVNRGVEVVEFACNIPHLLKGEFSEGVSTNVDAYALRQPLGVVAGITPFNFPVMVPMWMFPLAIACGNAFVLKPSEKTPRAPLRLAELFAEAGLPAGVFNVVNGERAAVDRLLEHPDVAAISFVGSTRVAEHVYKTGTSNGKRVQALGGAKNHAVVLPDADLDVAAEAIASAGYGSAGERCMALSVVVAVGEAGDLLLPRLKALTESVRVGPSLEADTEMGPLVTAEHHARVAGYVDTGVAEGAELVVDGRDVKGNGEGYFLGPCLFDRVAPDMTIYTDEIFGPVLLVVRAESLDEGIALINDNPYGNGASIFTNRGDAARRFQHQVTAGMVGINVPIPVPMAYYSFGGWKSSLFGDLHVHGGDGIRFYTRGKAVTARWPEREDATGASYAFPGGG